MKLSPATSRMVALGLLVLALLGLHAVLVRPVLDSYFADLDQIAEAEITLARYRAIAREAPALAERIAALEASGPAGYLEGSDEAMTAAALQNRLQMLVAREGGQLKSVQVLPAKPDGPALRIAVRGQMVAGTDALHRVLYQIEAGYLFVDNLEVRAISAPRGPENASTDLPLDVRFDVYGYMRGKT